MITDKIPPVHIGQIIKDDVANGPGIRLSVFLSGCRIHCKGCFQPQTWNFCFGHPVTTDMYNDIMNELSKPQYDGITVLGGEPFEPENQPFLLKLLHDLYMRYPHMSTWVYSGCTLDELRDPSSTHHTDDTDEILSLIDILVAGPFELDKKDITLAWCGSSNQKVIDMTRTRAASYQKIYEYAPES